MTPYYEHAGITIYHGDCRELMPLMAAGSIDCVITDPPYGETSLDWDVPCSEWLPIVDRALALHGSVWCFGSMRMFLEHSSDWSGFRFAQDVVWEKHNGSGFHKDRFKRVHENALQFYRGAWADVRKFPVYTDDATARTIRRKMKPAHFNDAAGSTYIAHDGGPRLMRSVITVRSCHGTAVHPTQKPTGIIKPLIEYSTSLGDVILDPFCGSGSVLLTAKVLGRTSIGIELEERYCEFAAKRLSQEVMDFSEATA